MVIFHGYVSHKQRVMLPIESPWHHRPPGPVPNQTSACELHGIPKEHRNAHGQTRSRCPRIWGIIVQENIPKPKSEKTQPAIGFKWVWVKIRYPDNLIGWLILILNQTNICGPLGLPFWPTSKWISEAIGLWPEKMLIQSAKTDLGHDLHIKIRDSHLGRGIPASEKRT